MFSSLEALSVSLIKSGHHNFKQLHEVIENRNKNANVELLERKGIFCYDYLDSFVRLAETKLPERAQFFSKLTSAECKPKDYEHTERVWAEFSCKTLNDYMCVYLLPDICILADVFEAFRANSLEEYQLDPAYYMSALQLAWSALLKFINRSINGQCVRMLYTDTDSVFLQFFVEDLAQELNRDQSMRDWFDFSEIPADHVSGL